MSEQAQGNRTLLIVEDDAGLQKQLKWCFADYETEIVADRDAALEAMRRLRPAVVTLDLGLPPDPANASEGLAVLEEMLAFDSHVKVIVVTGNDEREPALRAIALGAYDYYQKPIDPEVLGLIVRRAFNLFDLEEENRRLVRRQQRSGINGIIASSPSMLKVCETVEKVAPADVTVLLLGDSGTGKELLARALHELSPRAAGPFVAINCAAIPDTLLESELFGYEKGAFTGAAKQTRGKLEYANGGTLLLDEVGDLPAALQAKLLRFLQERVIERVGGRGEIPLDLRVVCATHKDLKALVAAGEFREDLYYRISEIAVSIPPLRERPGDAVLIARALLQQFARDKRKPDREFSQDAVRAIEAYAWPGNVREVENKVKRAAIMASGKVIEPADLELEGTRECQPRTLKEIRELAEADAVRQALIRADGQINRAAEGLGVSRPTIYHLMKKYDLSV
ncbi:MAG: PEP-CTERM-box response regulator transcription factor [Gammaproteobacteria bacterium]|nr:PEP-CTERM-box response regulator transcription factor [Gammaproteobacteria bacterium]